MANTSSAKKAVRKIERRTLRNKSQRSHVRSYIRHVEEAIASGNAADAQASFQRAQSELMRAAAKRLFHPNTASRKISRLNARIKALNV